MNMIPSVRTQRFDQLDPGDLFLYVDHDRQFYALKAQSKSRGQAEFAPLGPSLPQNLTGSFLLRWQPEVVLSFGKAYSIVLPTEAAFWSVSGQMRQPICLGIVEDRPYICVNGGHTPSNFFQCFVDLQTGEIVEARLPGHAVFTNEWAIVVATDKSIPTTIVKYPLPPAAQSVYS